jgi:uncharacterized membrane protein YidH (DUF202 family)
MLVKTFFAIVAGILVLICLIGLAIAVIAIKSWSKDQSSESKNFFANRAEKFNFF